MFSRPNKTSATGIICFNSLSDEILLGKSICRRFRLMIEGREKATCECLLTFSGEGKKRGVGVKIE